MGESDRFQDYKTKKQRFTLGHPDNALMWLFAFNVIFFLILATIKLAIAVNDNSANVFFTQVVNWFSLPASLGKFSNRYWTILTYMFSDTELVRAISNMLWLWVFGDILQNLTGNKKLIPIYLYGGIVGALFFIIATYLIPTNRAIIDSANLLGANASIMAVSVAATRIAYNYRFFKHIRGGIPIWVLTFIYIFIDIADVATAPAAQALSHIGGAFAGFLFITLLQNKIDASIWMNKSYDWFINVFNPNKKYPRTAIKNRVHYNVPKANLYNKILNVTEDKIDQILDKINQKGYNSLTKEEKDILKKASED